MELDVLLIPVNIAIYASIAVGLIQGRRRRSVLRLPGSGATFAQLEAALKTRFPDLPEGFTIREGLSKMRVSEPDLGWDQIEKSLEGYEAYRYGDGPVPSGQNRELEDLIHRLGSAW